MLLSNNSQFEEHVRELEKQFPGVPSIGCIGMSYQIGIVENGVAVIAFSDGVTAASNVLEEVSSMPVKYIRRLEQDMRTVGGASRDTVCIDFCTGNDACVLTTIYTALRQRGISLVGGTGDQGKVSANGRVYQDAVAYALVRNLNGRVKTYKENIYHQLGNYSFIASDTDRANYILGSLNGKPAKLFRSGALTVLELLMMNGYSSIDLLGRTGKNLSIMVDGQRMLFRGEPAVPCVLRLNGAEAAPSTVVYAGDSIEFVPAVSGAPAQRTLKDLLGEEGLKGLESGTDKNGNTTYALEINGVKIGDFTEKTELSTIISRINSNKDAGVNVSYSKLTNEFTFTAKETGTAGEIQFSKDGLGGKLFGAAEQTAKGQDAIFTATIDGKEMELTRSSNIVDFDGLSVTLKGEFGYKQAVDDAGNPKLDDKGNPVYTGELDRTAEKITFTTSSDSDKIVEAVKSFVNDYNEMVTQIKNAYGTLPMQRSNGAYYQPLTDEDKEGMTDSAIEDWEEKAKTGILFGDRDLSSLYSRLTSAVSMYGQDGADLKAAGITVNYSNGLSTLSFDEKTLRDTLDSDPDRVKDIFSKSTDNGAATNGLVAAIKEPLDIAFLFWAIAAGIVLAAGLIPLAVAGSVCVGAVLLALVNRKSHLDPYIMVLRCEGGESETAARSCLERSVKRLVVKSKTVQAGEVELQLELRLLGEDTGFVNTLASMEGVRSAALVSYNGDYMG